MTGMSFRPVGDRDVGRATTVIQENCSATVCPPVREHATLEALIKRDLEALNGPFQWWISETASEVSVFHIAVIPAPPIYELKGGPASIVLGMWGAAHHWHDSTQLDEIGIVQRRASPGMLVVNCPEADLALAKRLQASGYRATTNYMLKTNLTASPQPPVIRVAEEKDIPSLVAFNKEARERLHEANPTFWNSHPDAEARFAFWMKLSLSMRDRTIHVAQGASGPTGFVIAQPSSPIQVPITWDDNLIGVIDDFHCSTFGAALHISKDQSPAIDLLAAAETDLVNRGKTSAMAISPTAWPSKTALLTQAGYRTHSVWFTKAA